MVEKKVVVRSWIQTSRRRATRLFVLSVEGEGDMKNVKADWILPFGNRCAVRVTKCWTTSSGITWKHSSNKAPLISQTPLPPSFLFLAGGRNVAHHFGDIFVQTMQFIHI